MARRRNYRRGRGNGSNSDDAMAGLSQLLGLSLGLFAFDAMLDAIIPIVNDSTWFAVVITLVIALIPVFGILGAYAIIKKTIKKLKL